MSNNRTDFAHPRDSYIDLLRDFYAGINGADAAEPVREAAGDNWCCHTEVSRGAVLEKAGTVLLHIVDGKIYNSPGSIKQFETLAYPANPRVPGFVFLMNLNDTEAGGRSIVLFTDIILQTGERNTTATNIFQRAVQAVYERHHRDFADRFKTQPGSIMAGISAECGVMDFFQETDAEPFVDELLRAVLPAYREILDTTAQEPATTDDINAMYEHRARLVEWLTLDDIGIQFARASGMPLAEIEAYGYPPVVRY
ncbi:MAG: hypothetical protein QNJ73_00095 [Gammaproteobacteria bacterium]|nr:hypothetical protein [Gammaproteobacteria bacterium]